MTFTGSLIIAFLGMLAGVLISIFLLSTQTLITNHVATGLALTYLELVFLP
ncbi:MAG: hypothetical protein CM1200mP13_10930 [Candidatus Pelagibacterales bacterium]|nr:MAG: hypothetical protein CM1200mP13_10930 [Pelagibacterales bacterium]